MGRHSLKFLTLQEISRRCAEHGGKAHPTLEQLAKALRVDRNTVKTHVHDLEAEGRVAVKHSTVKGVANEYALTTLGAEDLRRGYIPEATSEASLPRLAFEGLSSSKDCSSKEILSKENLPSNPSEATPTAAAAPVASAVGPGMPFGNRITDLLGDDLTRYMRPTSGPDGAEHVGPCEVCGRGGDGPLSWMIVHVGKLKGHWSLHQRCKETLSFLVRREMHERNGYGSRYVGPPPWLARPTALPAPSPMQSIDI